MTRSPMSIDMATEKPRSAAILLLITVADTSWRMFVPTLSGTILGVTLDRVYNTVPLWTASMVALGVATAALLVRLQFKSLKH